MFYTLEGIDGAGCGVVRRELEKLLTEAKIPYKTLKYPVPNLPFGRDIYDYLDRKIDLSTDAQFLAFIGQMASEKNELRKLRKEVLIVDRYLPCTLVFQGAKGFSIDKGLQIAKLMELEMPDKIFYLQLPWQVAFERKNKEARASDLHESDPTLFEKTAKLYDELLEKEVLAPWVKIDATKTPGEEARQIFTIISKEFTNV